MERSLKSCGALAEYLLTSRDGRGGKVKWEMSAYLILTALWFLASAGTTPSYAETPSLWDGGKIPASNVAGKKLIRAEGESLGFCGAGSIAEMDLPAKVKLWQETGLDGLVFSVASHDKAKCDLLTGQDKGYRNMQGLWWNVLPRTYEEFLPEIEAFQSVKDWGRLTDNFLRTMSSVSGDTRLPDWFNDKDWEVVLANNAIAARIAKESGFKGLVLDVEDYDFPTKGVWRIPFNYGLYEDSTYKIGGEAKPKPFLEVAAKVRERGRQYAEAISAVYPDMTLFVWPDLYELEGPTGFRRLLYPAFFDGLLLGLDERATLVAGTELTYGDSQYANMLIFRDQSKEQALILSSVPELARKRITFSVGIWTDAGVHPDRFSDTDVRINHRDPERHKHAVHNALAASDKYAWQWGEISWLKANPTPLMREYWQANIDGHQPQDLEWGPEPVWDMTDYTAHDADMAHKDAAFWVEKEEEGWKVAVELPVYWKFRFDPELLMNFRSGPLHDYSSPLKDDSAWPFISILKCWQSQGTMANGPAIYRVRFDAPKELDPATQEIMLAFGGFSPGGAVGSVDSWMNVYGNKVEPMIDVTQSIKPGQSNFVAVKVLNRVGPAGLMGHVKLLVRNKSK